MQCTKQWSSEAVKQWSSEAVKQWSSDGSEAVDVGGGDDDGGGGGGGGIGGDGDSIRSWSTKKHGIVAY